MPIEQHQRLLLSWCSIPAVPALRQLLLGCKEQRCNLGSANSMYRSEIVHIYDMHMHPYVVIVCIFAHIFIIAT